MSDSHRWTLTDPQGNTTTLEKNPEEGGSPEYAKTFTTDGTLEPNAGPAIIWQGQDEVPRSSVTGTILTESHYNQLLTWYRKDAELILVDDLDREFLIVLTAFRPKRPWSRHPWRHGYTLDWLVLEER